MRPAGKHALGILCSKCRPRLESGSYCQFCGHWLPKLSWLTTYPVQRCRACKDLNSYFFKARSVRSYTGIWKKAVLYYKLSPAGELNAQFAALCYKYIKAGCLSGNWQGVSPVPKRSNSISASEQLAAALAKRLKVAYVPVLCFKKKTLPQHTLRRQQRLSNMKNSMQIKKKSSVQGRWLLVDDIYTTGATVNEGARALLAAGAYQVEVITLARGVDRRVGLE